MFRLISALGFAAVLLAVWLASSSPADTPPQYPDYGCAIDPLGCPGS